jgi:hypothetical protein
VCHMAKSNSVRTNMRLRDEARFALEELAERMGCSQTAVVERLVIAAHERHDTPEMQAAVSRQIASIPIRAADVPGVTAGPPLNAFCVHCEQKFAGPKGANICNPCGRGGHTTSGACRRCAQIAQGKERATSRTGVESPEVDYDWQDPA